MTPPDARVLIVATLIIVGVPVAVHEYRLHAHRHLQMRDTTSEQRGDWSATSGAQRGERAGRIDAPMDRPSR